jgi:hypothetical protein
MLQLLKESMQSNDTAPTEGVLKKLLHCMEEGQACLDRQKVIETDVLALEESLQRRKERNVRPWLFNRHANV